jgi:hypothetical protein
MTSRLEDFDFETTCNDLGTSVSGASQEARSATEIAGYALHYLFATGQLADFREYLRIAQEPVQGEILSEHVFKDMEQAEKWLASQPPPQWGVIIKADGRTYTVSKRAATRLVLLPSFLPEELKQPG